MLRDLYRERAQLGLEGAPERVQKAAERAIENKRQGLPQSATDGHILMEYAKTRQQQDRYGR
jgi:hypothetical protein